MKRITLEEVKDIIESNNFTWISGEYFNETNILTLRCNKCKSKSNIRLSNLKRKAKYRCSNCKRDEKLLWECALGHTWYANFRNVKGRGSWCPTCAIKKTSKNLQNKICR